MNKLRLSTRTICVLWSLCALSGAMGGPGADAQQARQILDDTAVKGGLIVHVGCGDGKLTAALRANDRYVVHGLDRKAK
ncbi:MAG: hypothetical protein ACYSWQ_26950, partial [Planctomycetota bacterium]